MAASRRRRADGSTQAKEGELDAARLGRCTGHKPKSVQNCSPAAQVPKQGRRSTHGRAAQDPRDVKDGAVAQCTGKTSGTFACVAGSPPHSHHCERECRPEKIRHARLLLDDRNRRDRNLIEHLASHGDALLAARLRLHRRAPGGCRGSRCRFLRTGVLRLCLLSVFHLRPTQCDAVSSAAVHTREIIGSAHASKRRCCRDESIARSGGPTNARLF